MWNILRIFVYNKQTINLKQNKNSYYGKDNQIKGRLSGN